MILKEDFIGIIDLYYPTMRYYQLIRLYFKIIDKENPYYYKPHYCKINFRKIHHNHHTYNCCCSFHQNKNNLQRIMKRKLNGSRYEKRIYKRACQFFLHLNSEVVLNNFLKIDNQNILNDWNFIYKNLQIKRNGYSFWINNDASTQLLDMEQYR